LDRRKFSKTVVGAALGAAAVGGSRSSAGDRANQANAKVPFQFSVMLWTVFRDLPFEQRLERVAGAGYTNVELVGENEKWSDEEFRRVAAKRKELGIRFDAMTGVKHGIATPNDLDAVLSELRAALPSMERLQCPAIIVLSGNLVPGLSREVQHRTCVEALKSMASLMDGKHVSGEPLRVLLECIDPEENPNYFLTSASEALAIIKEVNHPQVQFLYDIYHEQIAEGNLLKKLEKNIDRIGLIHVADVPGRHQPGTGEINYANIFRKLAELNYSKIVAMEFLPSGDPVQTLRWAREMAIAAAKA
jgi:hydroxypyruvate isomerase